MNNDTQAEYHVAFVKADGSWDIVETFRAKNDRDANFYALHAYDEQEWFVLDASHRNINGGDQE